MDESHLWKEIWRRVIYLCKSFSARLLRKQGSVQHRIHTEADSERRVNTSCSCSNIISRVEADIFGGILRDGKQNNYESCDRDWTEKNISGSGWYLEY